MRRLVAEQFPQWSDRPVRAVATAGTVNAIFRIGDDLAASLPVAGRGPVPRRGRSGRATRPPPPVSSRAPPTCRRRSRWRSGGRARATRSWSVADLAPGTGRHGRGPGELDRVRRGPGRLHRGPAPGGCARSGSSAGPAEVGASPTTTSGWRPASTRARTCSTSRRCGRCGRSCAPCRASTPDAMCHTDLTPSNVLVRDGRLAGCSTAAGLGRGRPARSTWWRAWHLLDAVRREVLRDALGCSEVAVASRDGVGVPAVDGSGLVLRGVEPDDGAAGVAVPSTGCSGRPGSPARFRPQGPVPSALCTGSPAGGDGRRRRCLASRHDLTPTSCRPPGSRRPTARLLTAELGPATRPEPAWPDEPWLAGSHPDPAAPRGAGSGVRPVCRPGSAPAAAGAGGPGTARGATRACARRAGAGRCAGRVALGPDPAGRGRGAGGRRARGDRLVGGPGRPGPAGGPPSAPLSRRPRPLSGATPSAAGRPGAAASAGDLGHRRRDRQGAPPGDRGARRRCSGGRRRRGCGRGAARGRPGLAQPGSGAGRRRADRGRRTARPDGRRGRGGAGPGAPGGPLVNLNTPPQPELETLPEVGPVTAAAILAWRNEHGGFSSVDELLEVDGIGDATLAEIAPHVTV